MKRFNETRRKKEQSKPLDANQASATVIVHPVRPAASWSNLSLTPLYKLGFNEQFRVSPELAIALVNCACENIWALPSASTMFPALRCSVLSQRGLSPTFNWVITLLISAGMQLCPSSPMRFRSPDKC